MFFHRFFELYNTKRNVFCFGCVIFDSFLSDETLVSLYLQMRRFIYSTGADNVYKDLFGIFNIYYKFVSMIAGRVSSVSVFFFSYDNLAKK